MDGLIDSAIQHRETRRDGSVCQNSFNGIGSAAESAQAVQPRRSVAARGIKRVIDITAALVGLVVLAPLMVVVALAIRLTMGQPVLFQQARPGHLAKPFLLFKFQTMREAYGADGQPLPDAERLTRLGRFLRKTSLDELPQLWNVLKGDLSLVGPRPLLVQYLPLYTPEQACRHAVRPGITGWAQVNGRNTISWEEKFEHDVWYVEHWSLGLDVKILWLTLIKVLLRKGVSAPGSATMPPFQGTAGGRL